MARSLKKGPYVHYRLMKRIIEAKNNKKKTVIKTWSRASVIIPDAIGLSFAVHNGKKIRAPLCSREHGRSQVWRIRTDS